MGLTGKYDFSGIQSLGVKGLNLILGATTWGAWLLSSAFSPVINYLEELGINYLANKGLILLNIGAIYVDGELDQAALDQAIDQGLERVKLAGATLSQAEAKDIDDAVIKAADKALPYSSSGSDS